MNTKHFMISTVLVTGLLLSAGCASFDSRKDEKSYVFNSLAPETKQRLEEGDIKIGDTEDMVYIALGEPDEKREKRTADGTESLWVYSSYNRQYEGDVVVGYQRTVRREGLLGGYTVTREPVSESVYSERIEDKFVVTFDDGRVSKIETNT
ncbi:MAG: hypothetical protein SynsKO_00570 [Synoicihabitans sp.]